MADYYTIRIAKLPGTAKDFTVQPGTTIADAINIAGYDAEGCEKRWNGTKVDPSTIIERDGTILITKQVKGASDDDYDDDDCDDDYEDEEEPIDYITVRAGILPGILTSVYLNGDRTVKAALDAVPLDSTNFDIKVNGRTATLDTILTNKSTVLLIKRIKGASRNTNMQGD